MCKFENALLRWGIFFACYKQYFIILTSVKMIIFELQTYLI